MTTTALSPDDQRRLRVLEAAVAGLRTGRSPGGIGITYDPLGRPLLPGGVVGPAGGIRPPGTPTAPTGLTLTPGASAGDVFIDASWTAPVIGAGDAVTDWAIEWLAAGDALPSAVKIHLADGPPYRIHFLKPHTSYTVTVRALTQLGATSAGISATTTTTYDSSVPGAPTGLSVIPTYAGVGVTWTPLGSFAVPFDGDYVVDVATNNTFTTGVKTQVVRANVATVEGYAVGTPVYARVRGRSSSLVDGTESATVGPTNVAGVPPTDLIPGALPAGVAVAVALLQPGALPTGVTLPPAQLTAGSLPSGVAVALALLQPGAVPSGVTIAAAQVSAGTLSAGVVYAGSVAAAKITAGTLDAAVIYAGDIAASHVTSGTLSAGVVYAGSVAASQIQAGTLSAGVVYAGSVAASQIQAGTLAAGVIYAGSIATSQISAGTLGAGVAYIGSLSAGQITGGTLDASVARITNLDVGDATVRGQMAVDRLAAGTIGAYLIELANGGIIRSHNYTTSGGTQGWQIDGAGNVIASSATVRGSFETGPANPRVEIKSDSSDRINFWSPVVTGDYAPSQIIVGNPGDSHETLWRSGQLRSDFGIAQLYLVGLAGGRGDVHLEGTNLYFGAPGPSYASEFQVHSDHIDLVSTADTGNIAFWGNTGGGPAGMANFRWVNGLGVAEVLMVLPFLPGIELVRNASSSQIGMLSSTAEHKTAIKKIRPAWSGTANPVFAFAVDEFRWNAATLALAAPDADQVQVGLIVEDVAAKAPNAVWQDKDGKPVALNRLAVEGYLVDAVQHLLGRIAVLEAAGHPAKP